jgi:hypothetical protein
LLIGSPEIEVVSSGGIDKQKDRRDHGHSKQNAVAANRLQQRHPS